MVGIDEEKNANVSKLLIKIKTKNVLVKQHIWQAHTAFLSLDDFRKISSEIIASLVEL